MKVPEALPAAPCRVSIVIKALNEERRIGAAVESALAAVPAVGGDVVLADSCSSDRTVALASAYPIRIVQLAHANERCCGVGPQLGYQHRRANSCTSWMATWKCCLASCRQAFAFMRARPEMAGVGGRVVEMNTSSLEYLARVGAGNGAYARRAKLIGWTWAGLSAVRGEWSGNFSDRNLHSYEEFDLAVRLRAKGWKCGVRTRMQCATMAMTRRPTNCCCAAGAAATSVAWANVARSLGISPT